MLMVSWILQRYLPLYIRVYRRYWLAMWSAPITPAYQVDYIRALRITLRKGAHHSERVLTFKRGTT